MLGQLIDVAVFHRIRSATGEKHVWLRATGSTAVSQLVDSFVVLYIAFVLGPQQWPISLFLAVSTVNYAYKMLAAIALIPLIYLVRAWHHALSGRERGRGSCARKRRLVYGASLLATVTSAPSGTPDREQARSLTGWGSQAPFRDFRPTAPPAHLGHAWAFAIVRGPYMPLLRPLALALALTLASRRNCAGLRRRYPGNGIRKPRKATRLNALYEQYWEELLKLNPLQATFQGDNRYNDQLPDTLSAQYRQQMHDFTTRWLKIDRSRSAPTAWPARTC